MAQTIPKSISEAARLLDEKRPGWFNSITRPVRQGSFETCILGQLSGKYSSDGFDAVFSELFPGRGCVTDWVNTAFGISASSADWQREVDERRSSRSPLGTVRKLSPQLTQYTTTKRIERTVVDTVEERAFTLTLTEAEAGELRYILGQCKRGLGHIHDALYYADVAPVKTGMKQTVELE